jgi:hypothetical protein
MPDRPRGRPGFVLGAPSIGSPPRSKLSAASPRRARSERRRTQPFGLVRRSTPFRRGPGIWVHGPPLGAFRSGIGDCQFGPRARKAQTAAAREAVECPRPQAWSLRCLPFSVVRTCVHVQHLPCHMTSFRQINDRLDDVVYVRDHSHRRQAFQKLVGVRCMHRRINNPRSIFL